MQANLANSAVAKGLEKSVFIPIPKKGNAKERSNYYATALFSSGGQSIGVSASISVLPMNTQH